MSPVCIKQYSLSVPYKTKILIHWRNDEPTKKNCVSSCVLGIDALFAHIEHHYRETLVPAIHFTNNKSVYSMRFFSRFVYSLMQQSWGPSVYQTFVRALFYWLNVLFSFVSKILVQQQKSEEYFSLANSIHIGKCFPLKQILHQKKQKLK